MHIVVIEVKTNSTGVPSKDKQTENGLLKEEFLLIRKDLLSKNVLKVMIFAALVLMVFIISMF